MADRVLIVDDVAANRELVAAHLEEFGYEVRHAADGVEALESIEAEEPDLILLDIEMPRMDGITVCRAVKAHPTRRLVPVVLITALGDRETRLRGLEAGADDFLTKPIDAKELLVRTRVLLRDRALNKRLDAAENVILVLAKFVEARDLYTVYHAERVGLVASAMGKLDGLSDEETTVLYRGGVLHDIGKALIPAEILLKAGPLTENEAQLMRQHSADGAQICLPLRSVRDYLPIVRHHHERWDGAGYPDHLAGEEIPRFARMVAVADSWDAMTSDRPYRMALRREQAFGILREGAGSQFHPEAVALFEHLLERGTIDEIGHSQFDRQPSAAAG